jgi:hypothetical protein
VIPRRAGRRATRWILRALLATVAARRPPDVVIGGPPARPYLRRWHLIPRNRWANVYLHQIVADDDAVLHDHPWANLSWVLAGGYYESSFAGPPAPGQPLPPLRRHWRPPGSLIARRAGAAHRLALMRTAAGQPAPAWSLFITGPHCRDWGFWCAGAGGARWVPWRDYTAGERAGRGCAP